MFEISPGIVVDPAVRAGKPAIKGTQVPVDVVVGRIAGGATYDELMRDPGRATVRRGGFGRGRDPSHLMVVRCVCQPQILTQKLNQILLRALAVLKAGEVKGGIGGVADRSR